MKKQRIVLASVLKPVDDTRMFEKMAKSLSRNPNYEIFIIGYPSQNEPHHPGIQFISHPNFNRLSLRRLITPLFILKKACKVKPDVFIVNTHELLIVGIAIRILFGSKIVYDVQENYWRNILWTDTFPSLVRPLLASWVRGKEILLSGYFHLFILAEKGFEKEMKFFRNKWIVLENKSLLPEGFIRTKTGETINLLFSGTISESTGVFEAIRLATGLYQEDRSVRLLIIGYCARLSTLKKLNDAIRDKPFISVIGGDHLVPHEEIISHIARSDFGIIYYPTSPHTENKIPTKLYEYLSANLPILIQDYMPWVKLCAPYPAAIPIDFNSPIDAVALSDKMKQTRFYIVPPTHVFWASEETLLLQAIRTILA
jgi:hypothetical protein